MMTIVVPELGESVVEARVARWLKKEGDRVAVGEPLVELETEKIDLEVSAERAGVLARIARREGEDVKVGEVAGRSWTSRGAPHRAATSAGRATAAAAPATAPPTPRPRRRAQRSRATGRRARRVTPAARVSRAPDVEQRGRPQPTRRAPARRRSLQPRRAAAPAIGRGRAAAHVEAARDDRAPAGRGAAHRRDADDVQRGRHDGRHGPARAPQGGVQEAARRRPRHRVVLRQGERGGAARVPAAQRRDPGRRDRPQALLRHRHRRRRGRRARRAGAARRRPHVVRRRSSARSATSRRRPRAAR